MKTVQNMGFFFLFFLTITACKKNTTVEQITSIDLVNHDIVLTDSLSGEHEQITHTKGKVMNLMVSPDGRLIAYEKELKQILAAGLFEPEETIPMVSVCSVNIYDIGQRKLIREIISTEKDTPFLRLNEWNSDDEFCYISAGHFDVSNIFLYQVSKDLIIDTNYNFHPQNRD